MKLRKRLENSKAVEWALSGLLSGYLRFCFRTTRWMHEGQRDLKAELANGPIILVLWHSRLLFGPVHWPRDVSRLATLRDPSPAGRLSSATQSRFGMEPYEMHDKQSNRAASRAILKGFADGISLGLTADGPLGPARQIKDAPLEWARATGRPVFFYAFAVKRHRRLGTWDKMMIPLPFTRGAFVYRRWDAQIDRRDSASDIEIARESIKKALDETQATADQMIGLPAGD